MARAVKKATPKTIEANPVENKVAEKEVNKVVKNEGNTFSVKLDNKKFSNRTIEQAMALCHASQGAVTKIIIELESDGE
ncbi:hypothetical protein F400_gp055 [Bacillus phage BCD7]|uniref:Uncharacterized protein n=1 Tax=Bacillus phage BCD7 TaxID=1136534 RepID=J9PUD1_9CAUD|nr:hypothetical protein F400_gp055 [Bacillus phage BCD7]AEZ50502.1 hypothetical protein BCD7_0055 [Bacillus phage BCD7]